MASLMKKFKRKRRLSSELHSRWGDPSISYPTQGSWNQQTQTSGLFSNLPSGLPHSPRPEDPRQYTRTSIDHSQSQKSNSPVPQYTLSDPRHADSVIPKGYFNENIRHREKRHESPARGLGIGGTRHNLDGHNGNSSVIDDDSCDEDDDDNDEERDTLGDSGGTALYRHHASETPGTSYRDEYDSYPDQAAKSPPLSVTSRMRRVSAQSSTTEHSSILGPASSRRTSYTAASSVSAPSLPPDTPRYAVHAHFEKRAAPRARYRAEPAPAVGIGQGMVPSYDELYG